MVKGGGKEDVGWELVEERRWLNCEKVKDFLLTPLKRVEVWGGVGKVGESGLTVG